MGEEFGKGIQIKDQDELIGKGGFGNSLKSQKVIPKTTSSSEDEQFFEATENQTASTTQTNEVQHDFNKLNQEFSGRIQIIGGSAEESGTKGKGEEVKTDTENGIMNVNRKRIRVVVITTVIKFTATLQRKLRNYGKNSPSFNRD
ncbi:hypothetical protein RhiirA1_459586 [Rhizophagus irregularis]|uniref:Uncharacterized protein n=1 Tax=Rhizophagus irregularis TaxID=588596 RepID=A0A2N0RTC2_9GLOM|nr:hypothetical protein RhiirA1_459586 [Rhizophagus irregularis]